MKETCAFEVTVGSYRAEMEDSSNVHSGHRKRVHKFERMYISSL